VNPGFRLAEDVLDGAIAICAVEQVLGDAVHRLLEYAAIEWSAWTHGESARMRAVLRVPLDFDQRLPLVELFDRARIHARRDVHDLVACPELGLLRWESKRLKERSLRGHRLAGHLQPGQTLVIFD